MTKASSIFDVYPWFNWITKDKGGRIYVWEKKPKAGIRFWTQVVDNKSLGFIEIDDFKDKDWKECIVERPKEIESWEDLKEWMLENGGEIYEKRDFVFIVRRFVYYVVLADNGLVLISHNGDIFYKGTPAQVKRVLEAMLND